MIIILLLTICKYQSYGGETKAKAYTIKTNKYVSFAFTKTGLLLSEQWVISESLLLLVKRLCCLYGDVNTLSFSIFKLVQPIKTPLTFSCVRCSLNFFSSWDLFQLQELLMSFTLEHLLTYSTNTYFLNTIMVSVDCFSVSNLIIILNKSSHVGCDGTERITSIVS